MEVPNTTASCDAPGCEDELSLLTPHLKMMLKPETAVLVARDLPTDEPDAIADVELSLGTKSGRGVLLKFHDFDCLRSWADDRKGLKPKLEAHKEEGDPYVPADNRTPEELVDAGELPAEVLSFQEALAERGTGGGDNA